MDFSPLPSLLVQEYYANIQIVSRRTFRVFLRGTTIKITPDVISSTMHIPRVVHPLFPYLSTDTLPANFLVRSTLLNSPLEGV